jgi:glycosyltransferase involved in cell wall biosynthesis
MGSLTNTRTRVLFVDNLAVEPDRRAVYQALAKRDDLEVHLLVPKSWKELERVIPYEVERDPLLTIRPTGFLFGYRWHRVIYTGLLRVLREIQPHFLYVDTEPENYAALQALIVRRLVSPSIKLALVSSRNIDHLAVGFPYRASFTHRLCDSIIRRSKVEIMFVRTKAAVGLVGAYANSTCHIPFPVDCSHFKREQVTRRESVGDQMTIGFLGRLIGSKGIQLLIESLPYLPESARLLIVGKGPLAKELQSLAMSLSVGQRIKFLPSVAHSEVPNVLNQMDILVLPSLDTKYWLEQCPRVLIEAMACEVPIVASDSGGIPEVVGDAGLLFRRGDVGSLLDKLLECVKNDSLRAEMARKGRERAQALYDVPIIADRIAEAIHKTLDANS